MIHLRRMLTGIGVMVAFIGPVVFFFWCVFTEHWFLVSLLAVSPAAYLIGVSFEATAREVAQVEKYWEQHRR